MFRGTIRLAAITVAALIASFAGAQEMYRLPTATWRLVVPAGWEVGGAVTLNEITRAANEELEKMPGAPKVSYVILLQSTTQEPGFVLVQRTAPLAKGLDFGSASTAIINATGKLKDKFKVLGEGGTELEPMVADRQTKRLITRSTANVGTDDAIGTVTVVHFGKDNNISVIASAPLKDFSKREAELRSIAEGIVFDSGAEYVFALTPPRSPAQWMGELIAFAIGPCLLIILYLKRRKSAARSVGA